MLTFFVYNLPKKKFTMNPLDAQKRIMSNMIMKNLQKEESWRIIDPDVSVEHHDSKKNNYFLLIKEYKSDKAEIKSFNETMNVLTNNLMNKTSTEEELLKKKNKKHLPFSKKMIDGLKSKTEQIAMQTSQAMAMSVAGIFFALHSTAKNKVFNNIYSFSNKEKERIKEHVKQLALPHELIQEQEQDDANAN